MIRVVYNLDTKEIISVINGADGQTYFDASTTGILQGKPDDIVLHASAFGLALEPILTFFDSNNIMTDMDETVRQVVKNKTFGQQIMNKFIAARAGLPASADQDLQIMDYSVLGDVRELLYDGSIKSAREKLLTKSEQIIPTALRDAFVEEMEEYLTLNGYEI